MFCNFLGKVPMLGKSSSNVCKKFVENSKVCKSENIKGDSIESCVRSEIMEDL